MAEIAGFLDSMKPYGNSALIFAIWYFYHKSITDQYKTIFSENFKLLHGMLENALLQNGLLQEIRDIAENNKWCPYARKFMNMDKGGDDDKSSDNAA